MTDWAILIDKAERLEHVAANLTASLGAMDILPALRAVNRISQLAVEIAGDVVETAGRETKITQKALAEALGVPPSTLRGLRR